MIRRVAVATRRRLYRVRRKRHPNVEEVEEAEREYRLARCSLRDSIRKTKRMAWEELLAAIDEDPWGRPYKMVLRRIRGNTPPITESVSPQFLGEIVERLFPVREVGLDPYPLQEVTGMEEIPEVTERELEEAFAKMSLQKAPGLDGITGKIWSIPYEVLGGPLRHVFERCLREGVFPGVWKKARLVLLPKEKKEAGDPSSYRLLCLLDEAGKILERIIVGRLVRFLSRKGCGLHDGQFGFREGRSTIDTVERLKTFSEDIVGDGEVALAVSLDIANAFNILPWE